MVFKGQLFPSGKQLKTLHQKEVGWDHHFPHVGVVVDLQQDVATGD